MGLLILEGVGVFLGTAQAEKNSKKFFENYVEVSSFCSDVIFINIEITSEINQKVINPQ